MIGQDGKVLFVRHGTVYVCVPSYRLVHVGKEFNKHNIGRRQWSCIGGKLHGVSY